MPRIHKKPRQHPAHDALVQEIVHHLRAAEGDALPEQPRIIEEQVSRSPALRVFVIWDRWEEIADERERNEIILEAYERALGRETMAHIAVVRGLTSRMALEIGATHLLDN